MLTAPEKISAHCTRAERDNKGQVEIPANARFCIVQWAQSPTAFIFNISRTTPNTQIGFLTYIDFIDHTVNYGNKPIDISKSGNSLFFSIGTTYHTIGINVIFILS